MYFFVSCIAENTISGRAEKSPDQTQIVKQKKTPQKVSNDGRSIRQGKRKLVLITALEEGVFLLVEENGGKRRYRQKPWELFVAKKQNEEKKYYRNRRERKKSKKKSESTHYYATAQPAC